jgi:hypothetical protein
MSLNSSASETENWHFLDPRSLDMKWVLGGIATAAAVGTLAYLTWKDLSGGLVSYSKLVVLGPYLLPPYVALYFLAPHDGSGTTVLIDRILAILTAMGLLGFWGWYATIPPTPQNAQAAAGLFIVGWVIAAAPYGTFKIVVHEVRRARDQ